MGRQNVGNPRVDKPMRAGFFGASFAAFGFGRNLPLCREAIFSCCASRPRASRLDSMHGGGMDGDTDRLRGKQDSLLVCTDGPKAYVWKSVNALFFSNYLNLLMLCTPFAVLARQHGSDGVIFAFSLLAIAPFAERLSFVTEQLALHTNETKPPQGRRAALRAPQRATPASWVWHGWLRLAPRAYSSGQSPSEPKREAGGGGLGPTSQRL